MNRRGCYGATQPFWLLSHVKQITFERFIDLKQASSSSAYDLMKNLCSPYYNGSIIKKRTISVNE